MIWSLVAYLFLRWILATLPGYTFDVQAYKRWALHAARDGFTRVYTTSDFDYPPLYAYLLYPLGKLYGLISPEALQQLADTTLLTVLVKLPPLLFDLLIALLLRRFALGLESRNASATAPPFSMSAAPPWRFGRVSIAWRDALPWLYLLHPAVLWDTGYWGQPDSIHSFFVLAAFLWLARGAAEAPIGPWNRAPVWPAWTSLALATLMKPLGAPFFPLLLVVSLQLGGIKGTLWGIVAAGVTTVAVLAPFLASGEASAFVQRLVGDVGAMPYTSVNGHNLWWALGGWRNAEEPWLGPLTATQVGLVFFGLFLTALLARLVLISRQDPRAARGAVPLAFASTLGFGFFMLSTHMHENHLFIVIPLLLPLLAVASPARRGITWVWLALGFGVLMNLVLHDLAAPSSFPFTLGGPSEVTSVHMKRPFFVAELWAIRFATFWNLALFGALLVWVFRPKGRDLASGLLVAVIALTTAGAARAAPAVVLELFTSEGCSSSPPAEDVLGALISRPRSDGVRVIGLAFHIDYWDPLGWVDAFGSPEATERQRAYAQRFRLERIYTPQMVIGGVAEEVGSRRDLIERAIEAQITERAVAVNAPRSEAPLGEPTWTLDGQSLRVRVEATGLDGAARVLLAVTEAGLTQQVTEGENAGKNLRHAAVVRAWRETRVPPRGGEIELALELPADLKPPRARVLLLLQDEDSGRYVATSDLALASIRKKPKAP